MRSGRQRGPQKGFAYLILLLAIALIGIAASSAVSLGATMARRDAELQLLAIGAEFDQALRSYAGVPGSAAAVAGARGPRNLEDLLRDSRFPGVRRHLRQLYADPLTGSAEWGLVRDREGYIIGLHSLARGRPIKRSGFAPRLSHLEEAEDYASWYFGLHEGISSPRKQ
jgi:type II secretory pathway pseudopilin PulG